MDKIEEVRKIPIMRWEGTYFLSDDEAQQICQLFEPKPDGGRLLTDEEFRGNTKGVWDRHDGLSDGEFWHCLHSAIATAQDAKTASIKDAECQAGVKRIFKEIEQNSEYDIIAKHSVRIIIEDVWQALKKKEGVE